MDNTHEKMRILEMVRKGLITTQEGVLRIRAIEKQVATTKVHYNVFEWRKLVLHPATHPMKILYFGNGDLCRNGVSVLQVTYGDHYKFSTDGCIIDPCCPEHYERLLIDAGAWEQEISILHSWANGEYVGAKEIIDRQKQLSVESIFHLVKALLHGGMKRRCNIVFRYPISADGKVNPIFAAVGSFARVAYNENPNINIKVVAQEPEGDPEQCFGAFNAEGSEFRLYGGCLYGKSFRETSIDTAVEYKPTHGDVYLITGGAGGLGKMFAKSLAERYEAKLVLIGRSPISDSVKSLLTQIEQLGGEAVYLSADVSDFSSVKDAVAQARARFGHVNGVIHAAGVILDSFIYNKSIEDWNAVLAPKIYGTAALLEATSNDKLKFFVTFSSIAAQIGGIGQADYAYANGFMDSLMVQCFDANLSCRYLSINWPLWRDGGMKADKRLVEMAEGTSMFNMLESHQGIEDFYKMLGIDEKQIMVVVDNENRSEQSVKSQQIVIDRKIECSDEVKQKTYEYLMELIELETGNAKGRINAFERRRCWIDNRRVSSQQKDILSQIAQDPKKDFEYNKHESNVVCWNVVDGSIALVKMMDMDNRNMFTNELQAGLRNAFEEIERNDAIKVVVVTGYDNIFCMGGTREQLENISRGKKRCSDTDFAYLGLLQCKIPVISAMQGHAAGGGFVFGMFADIIVLAEQGTYSTNFTQYGFTPGVGCTYILKEKLGEALANEMMYSAQMYTGKQLKERGVNVLVVKDDSVVAEALSIAKNIAQKPAATLRTLKNELASRTLKILPSIIESEINMHNTVFAQIDVAENIERYFIDSDRTKHSGNALLDEKCEKKTFQSFQEARIDVIHSHDEERKQIISTDMSTKALKECLMKIVCNVMHVTENDVKRVGNFKELGVDSISGVEIIRDINNALDTHIEVVKIYDYPSYDSLCAYLMDKCGIIQNDEDVLDSNEEEFDSDEELLSLFEEISENRIDDDTARSLLKKRTNNS